MPMMSRPYDAARLTVGVALPSAESPIRTPEIAPRPVRLVNASR